MRTLCTLLIAGALAAGARGQCSSFQPAYPGLNGAVRALGSWTPDGVGPQLPRLVAGGAFTWDQQGSQDYIACWDGQAWAGLGWGTDGPVNTIVVWDPDGPGPLAPQLIIGGEFTHVGADSTGEVAANHIARWDGVAWRALGSGFDGNVRALTVWDPNGDGSRPLLVAGGAFSIAGGVPADDVAVWDGAAWSTLGWGFNGAVNALTTWDRDGGGPEHPWLVAGGEFAAAGSDATGEVAAIRVAAWDGDTWRAMSIGDSSAYPVMRAVTFDFDGPGPGLGVPVVQYGGQVFRWNGTGWETFARTPINTEMSVRTIGVEDMGAAGQRLWIAADTYYWWEETGPPFCTEGCWHFEQRESVVFGMDASGYPVYPWIMVADVLGQWDPDGAGPAQNRVTIAGPFADRVESANFTPAPVVISQPSPAHAVVGGSAHFTFGVAPDSSMTYQWYQVQRPSGSYPVFYEITEGVQPSGSTMSGTRSPTLTIANVSYLDGELAQPDQGSYYTHFQCLARNACGYTWSAQVRLDIAPCSADFDHDGDAATDADIEAFFRCIAGNCCARCESADFDGDGDAATDLDIEAFFRVLAGGPC